MYYLPGVTEADLVTPVAAKGKLEQLGLGHLEVSAFPTDAVLTGISIHGSTGVLLIPNTTGGPPDCHRYEPANQTWIEFGKFWIGVCNNDLPHPELIARRNIYPGYSIPDASNRIWQIPIARSTRGKSSIPSNYTFGPDRKPIAKPKSEFNWLWEISGILFDHWSQGGLLTIDEMIQYAVQILGVNYRFSFAEAAVLAEANSAVVDDRFAQFVTLFVIDNPLLEEFQKKSLES